MEKEIKLIGIKVRTSNAAEFNTVTGKIGKTIQKYFQEGVPNLIENRENPGTTYCVYTEYESNLNGYYTYFIGETVTSFENIPRELSKLVIPMQKYVKFTTEPGIMPDICIDMWKKIWSMGELDEKRNYLADFEVYDERASDPKNTVLDIYIGVNSNK